MPPIKSVQWLYSQRNNPDIIILDSSLEFQISSELEKDTINKIPNSLPFDYANHFCDQTSTLPHMFPSASHFNNQAQALGINNDSIIIVYDNSGTYASPRAWWMFKTMNHNNVFVLNGGLTAWKSAGYPTELHYKSRPQNGNFYGNKQSEFFINVDTVQQKITDEHCKIVDARSRERFTGQASEPREGMRSGHIPSAINIPFVNVIENGKLKSEDQLEKIFISQIPSKTTECIFSCGSGVTACILALAATSIGYNNIKVYDGSWSEWGKDSSRPIELSK